MSDMVNVNFKLDAETKRGMEQACKDMGLSLSAACGCQESQPRETYPV